MRFVIIGNSAAGVNAAQELRAADKDSQITIVSSEKDMAYSRCLISRFLDGRLKADGLYFKTRNFYHNYNVKPLLGKTALSLDRSAKEVILASGERLAYDKLLLAVGAGPIRPRVSGLELSGIFNFYSLEDPRRIIKYAKDKNVKEAVVVGAGFVGLEAAYALSKDGIKVTVVERCAQILPAQFDHISSEIIRDDLESLGLEIILDESLTSVNGESAVESVTIGEDTDIACSLVIFASGVRPNTLLAQESKLNTAKGIVVDEFLKTNDPDIFAAGDCIEIEDAATGKRQPSATWFNAVLQGKFAAGNMLGQNKRYSGAIGIQNSVQFHRLAAISFGISQITDEDLDYEVISHYNKEKKVYKKLVLKDNILRGMIFTGDILKAGFYAALIREKIDVGAYKHKLLEPDFSYAYFRKENFGQTGSYAATPSCWQSPSWFAERSLCMGIK